MKSSITESNSFTLIGNKVKNPEKIFTKIGFVLGEMIKTDIKKFFLGCSTEFDVFALLTLTVLKNKYKDIEINVVNTNFDENYFEDKQRLYKKFNCIDFFDRKEMKLKTYKKMIDKSIGVVTYSNLKEENIENKAIGYTNEQNKKVINIFNF